MALKDLYMHLSTDDHLLPPPLLGFHPDIVRAHNMLVEELMVLRKRVRELEKKGEKDGSTNVGKE